MKIHLISNSLRMNSGFSIVARNLAIGLKKLGHEITFTGMQTAYLSEWSYGIDVLPIQVYYIDDVTQLMMTLNRIKPDVVLAIFQMDIGTNNPFTKVFPKTAIYCPAEGKNIPYHMANDLLQIKMNGGVVVAQCQYGQSEMKLALGGLDVPYIFHGYDPDIFKPLDLKKIDDITYCYYKTEDGKVDSDPLLLHRQMCYDCQLSNKEQVKCPYYKEEQVSILRFINGKWTEESVPITELSVIMKGKFTYLFIGQNIGVRKRAERLIKAYSLFIKDSKQLKDRTVLHLHTKPIAIDGINLIKVIQDLGIEKNIIFSYGAHRSSGWTEQAINILYNIANINISASSSEGFCVIPGTPILTLSRGIQKIKDIKVGDKVLTHKGRFMRVVQVTKREYLGDLIKITSNRIHIPIFLTPEHKVLAVRTELCKGTNNKSGMLACRPGIKCYNEQNHRKYKYCKYISGEEPYRKYKTEWVDSRDLKIRDFVVYPRCQEKDVDIEKIRIIDYIDDLEITGDNYNDNTIQSDLFGGFIEKTIKMSSTYSLEIPSEIRLTKDFMRLCGYFIAEGNINQDYAIRFGLHIEENEYINDIEKLMRDIFGLVCHHDFVDGHKNHNLRFHNKIVARLFINLFAPKEYQKGKGHDKKTHVVRIPPEFMNLSKDKLVELIKGIWRGDGNKDIDRFSISTTSETLAWQIVYILSKFNILTSIRIDDTNKKHSEKWSLNYSIQMDGDDAELFGHLIQEECICKENKKLQVQKYIKGRNYYYLPIKKIDIIKYSGDVWNLEVEEDNSYVSSIVLHNCLPVLEGFATGLPMIAPNCSSFTELIGEDPKTRRGLLASIIDWQMIQDGSQRALVNESDLANQMKTIYQSEELRKTFSKNAIKFAQNYTWEKICQQWDQLLKTIK